MSQPGDEPAFRVYLSSTLEDMRDERAAAIEVLRRHAQVTDSYEASPEPTVEKCLSDVRASHAYVLILGRRYGWVPAGADDPDALSITEQEYEACRGDGVASIPRLVFIRTTNADRYNDDEARPQTAARMRRFRARAAADQLAYPFDTLEQFKLALAEAIVVTRQQHIKEVRKPATSEGGIACLRLVPWMLGRTLQALPGAPVLEGADGPWLAGGARIELLLSHDKRSTHAIVVDRIEAEWTFVEFQKEETRPAYTIDGRMLPPQGFFTPERFQMVLDGARVRSASWVFGAAREPLPIDEADLLQTDPPRRLRLDSEGDDIAALAGVVRLVTPGRYTLRWRVGYSIAGQPNELVSEPFHLVHDE